MFYGNFRIIFDKIDKNGDEQVTEKELEEWIRHVQTRYLRVDTDRQWTEHNEDNATTLTWTSYKHKVYAFIEGSPTDMFIISNPLTAIIAIWVQQQSILCQTGLSRNL